MPKKVIVLGQEVKDRVSGFTGTAIARTTYLQGCDRISVQPKVTKSGELPAWKTFDEPDLVVIGKGVAPGDPEEDPGGPRIVPGNK